jgi:hypothetical protein
MDAMDRFGEALVEAGRRRRFHRWTPRAVSYPGFGLTPRHMRPLARLRIGLVVLALAFATTAIALAATGVILAGSPVHPVIRPTATAGEGLPVEGGARLLPLRVPDPAGGPPWGMRVVHTTRGLICVQVGRVDDGQLGELGIDGAFHDDGRFHPLQANAVPDALGNVLGLMSGRCSEPGKIYASQSVGWRPAPRALRPREPVWQRIAARSPSGSSAYMP